MRSCDRRGMVKDSQTGLTVLHMATRTQLYAKFGITTGAAQLFETELATLLLWSHGLEHGWHVAPDGRQARTVLDKINRDTLGRLLARLKQRVTLDDDLEIRFASTLQARNRLIHGFYEQHNFKIQTREGRGEMIADLEVLHDELFRAWQLASAMTSIAFDIARDEKDRRTEKA